MIALARLKEYVRRETGFTADDALLQQLERSAVAFLERACGRYFGPVKQFVDYSMLLRYPPIEGTLAVEYQTSYGGAWATVDPADVEVKGRIIRLHGYYPVSRVRATYNAGYTAGTEPEDIQLAVMRLVVHGYVNRSPVVEATVSNEVPLTVNATVERWRDRRL